MVAVTTCSATTANTTFAGCALVTGKHMVRNTMSVQGNYTRPHFTDRVGIWNPIIWNPETLEIRAMLLERVNTQNLKVNFKNIFLTVLFCCDVGESYPIFKGSGYNFSHSYGPNHLKIGPFKIGTFCPDFKLLCDKNKMAAICQDFKWLGFRISDPIWNLDHLQTELFFTIWNPD